MSSRVVWGQSRQIRLIQKTCITDLSQNITDLGPDQLALSRDKQRDCTGLLLLLCPSLAEINLTRGEGVP